MAKSRSTTKRRPASKSPVSPKRRSASATGGDATWAAQQSSNNDWDTASNWSSGSVPTGTATFGASSQTNIVFSDTGASVAEIAFTANAPAYTFTIATADDTPTPKVDRKSTR